MYEWEGRAELGIFSVLIVIYGTGLRPLNEPISARVVPLEQITFVLGYSRSCSGLDDYMAGQRITFSFFLAGGTEEE